MRLLLLVFSLLLLAGCQPAAYGQQLPWLTVTGESRIRYEALNRQFRAGRAGDNRILLIRSLLHAQAGSDRVFFGLELQDSRAYLSSSQTSISRSFVNPLDVLQLYGEFQFSNATVMFGRQTVNIGSRRQISRSNFGNVIKTYTGIHVFSEKPDRAFHAVLVAPVGRLPEDRLDLAKNKLEPDREQWGRTIWALFYRRQDALAFLPRGSWTEGFIYGLHERDQISAPTSNRNYVTSGFRFYRGPEKGQWHADVEGALRLGSRYASSDAQDQTALQVRATMLYAVLGYSFNNSANLRLALQFYWASGDKDAGDQEYGRYERLFGSRRSDLNHTSLHGPLTPSNLSAPGIRMAIRPTPLLDARVTYSAAFLASRTDQWVVAKLQDPTGEAGRFIGHELDSRIRYWMVDDIARLELGASVLKHGSFSRNAPDSSNKKATWFGYSALSVNF